MPKIKGVALTLAGDVYTVPPLSLGDFELLQDRLGSLKVGAIDKESVGTVIDATFASLKRNYPEMTRETVAGMIDLENMVDVIEAVMDVSGAKRKALEADAAKKAGATTEA